MSTHATHIRLTLSARDLADLCVVIAASTQCDRVLRDLSSDETHALHARVSAPLALGMFGGNLIVSERDLTAIANITMALDIQGAGDFPALSESDITDRRLDELCDMIWRYVAADDSANGGRRGR